MTTIEKEKIMKSMLDSLREHMKFYREVTTKELANVYLGELNAFEIYYNIVAARGMFSDEARDINDHFKKEFEGARQLLVKKFESGELK